MGRIHLNHPYHLKRKKKLNQIFLLFTRATDRSWCTPGAGADPQEEPGHSAQDRGQGRGEGGQARDHGDPRGPDQAHSQACQGCP